MNKIIKKYGVKNWLWNWWNCYRLTWRNPRKWKAFIRNTELPYELIAWICIGIVAYMLVGLAIIRVQIINYQHSYYTTPTVIHIDKSVSRVNAVDKINGIISHYTASEDETDDSPCFTANMTNICPIKDYLVANNCLKFGTIVEIKGIKYKVADRMNKRYGCGDFDILVGSKKEARNLGILYTQVSVYK